LQLQNFHQSGKSLTTTAQSTFSTIHTTFHLDMFTYHKTLTLTALIAACASSANAHMQMSWPYPLHSTFNPKTPESAKDYSMTSPLLTDGIYPCKGFINSPSGSPYMDSVVTWKAGQTVNVTLAGTATHKGGSCQFSMSYDEGATWNVIKSYVGGCLTDSTTIDVDLPSEAPSGEALFAWTWFNHAGKSMRCVLGVFRLLIS
jgi:hypothetical protein